MRYPRDVFVSHGFGGDGDDMMVPIQGRITA